MIVPPPVEKLPIFVLGAVLALIGGFLAMHTTLLGAFGMLSRRRRTTRMPIDARTGSPWLAPDGQLPPVAKGYFRGLRITLQRTRSS